MVLTSKWDRIQPRSERTHANTKISTYRAASPKYIKARACREEGVVLIMGDGTMEQWWNPLNLLNNIFLKLYFQRRTAGHWKQNFSFCGITCSHWRSRSRVRKWSATAEADQSHFLNIYRVDQKKRAFSKNENRPWWGFLKTPFFLVHPVE